MPETIQGDGRPPSLKIEKSRYLHNQLTDFYEIWHADALNMQPKNNDKAMSPSHP